MSTQPQNPGALLREVARLYTRAQRLTADCCRTTNTQCHILTELGRTGAQPMVELGQRLCLEKSWVSRALDSLVEEGLVAKSDNPSDARSWIVSLTATGKRRVDRLNESLDEHASRLLDDLSNADRKMVSESLQLVLNALRAEAGIESCCASNAEKTAAKRRAG